MTIHDQLIQLRELLDEYPNEEFMCHLAERFDLYQAKRAMHKRIKAYEADTSCLINIYCEALKDYRVSHRSPQYQTYRKEWLDALIKEYK